MNWALILQAAGILVMLGIHLATVRFHGDQIKELKQDHKELKAEVEEHGHALARGKLL